MYTITTLCCFSHELICARKQLGNILYILIQFSFHLLSLYKECGISINIKITYKLKVLLCLKLIYSSDLKCLPSDARIISRSGRSFIFVLTKLYWWFEWQCLHEKAFGDFHFNTDIITEPVKRNSGTCCHFVINAHWASSEEMPDFLTFKPLQEIDLFVT